MNSFLIKDNYRKLEKIGEGTYGIVYKAKNSITKEIVAIKKIRIEQDDDGLPYTAIREISLLKEIKHPYIVTLKDIHFHSNKLYLIFELLECDLRQYLLNNEILDRTTVKNFTFQLLLAINHCHQNRIIHRDLKPQNILVDSQKQIIKIADFGLARTLGIPLKTYTHEVITLWYRAPEILLGQRQYSTPVDIWSLGCIFAEIAQKRPLFKGDSEIDQIFKIFKFLGTPKESIWPGISTLPDYKITFPKWPIPNNLPLSLSQQIPNLCHLGLDLLSKLITYDPSKRITAQDALKHPYFDEIIRQNQFKQQ